MKKGYYCNWCKKFIPEGRTAYSVEREDGIYCSKQCLMEANVPPIQKYTLDETWAQYKGEGLVKENTRLDETTLDVLESIKNLEID